MVVLLKTVSVQVNFIQIMQIRVQNKRKSIRKSRYIGDVSTGLRILQKNRFPLTAGTHQLHLCTQRSVSVLRKKYMILPLTARTHQLYLRTQGSASLPP